MFRAPDSFDASDIALFLDVDGTLLEIRENPADVVADDELIDILQACSVALGGAMCLVSGRSIEEVDRIFAPATFPVAGAHGAEFRFDGGRTKVLGNESLPADVTEALEAFVAAREGLLIEHKRGGVSLHYRRAPELERECWVFIDSLMARLGDAFRLIAGKMVLEIAPSGHNKGAAIEMFLTQPPFSGRTPVFVGDDVTDEDGFRAVNEASGTSIRIGAIDDSAAEYHLPDVPSVRSWLGRAILGRHRPNKTGEKRS